MKVVLFCGGQGTRIRDASRDLPKPLVNIGSRPILWHIMKYYAHFGHKDFILCLGYKGEEIKKYFLEYDPCLATDFTLSSAGKVVHRKESDVLDWNITFADTGQMANIGQRLRAVEPYLGGEEIFLANYADALTDMQLPELLADFKKTNKVACFLCVKPSQTFHVVSLGEGRAVKKVTPVKETDIVINGGYFIFRRAIFNYIGDQEDLVNEPFRRLTQKGLLMGYRYDRFWYCMDTFKEHQELNDMHSAGQAPWEIWK